jgi:molybdopterin-guanine dinucleotide biosynthesis protein A
MAPVTPFDPMDITAAILAGGAGTRLGGRDKGLAVLAGNPLVAHVVASLKAQSRDMLICINRNAERYAAFATVCPDRIGGFHGPLAGIDAALAACATPWLLTVPVDCPLPPKDLAQRLRDAAGTANAQVAVAHDGIRRQPLFAIYRCELGAGTSQALSEDLAVWRWQDINGAIEVDFSDAPQAFLNLNTVEEFRVWEEHQRD